jgi:hypothetical protein
VANGVPENAAQHAVAAAAAVALLCGPDRAAAAACLLPQDLRLRTFFCRVIPAPLGMQIAASARGRASRASA